MAKTTDVAAELPETEACLRITAPGGPHWRGGLQFGREPVLLGEAEIEAAAAAKGLKPEEIADLLRTDPLLAIVPERRPKAPAAPAA